MQTPSSQIPPDDIVAMIREAANSVFSTMLNLPLENQAPRQESGDPDPVHGVVALVGIAGSWTGMGRMYCSAEFAQKVANAMLFAQHDSVNEEVLDSVAEIANMIVGNVKTSLEERLGSLGLGVPTVIYGRNYQAHSANITQWTVVPFRCATENGVETMEVRFCLMPTRISPRAAALRHEPVPA
jgi:chemotaxis protein CheX